MWPLQRNSLDIFAYHSIVRTTAPLDDWCFLPLARFEAQMEAIRRSRRPVLPLVEAVERLTEGRLDRASVVLTFDDGFLDNIELALPVLERYGFPATIFLTTGVTGSARTLWPSRLVRALMETQATEVRYRGETFPLGDMAARGKVSARLQAMIKQGDASDPAGAVTVIEEQLGVGIDAGVAPDSPFAMMGPEHIDRGLRSGLIEFGAHSVTHPLLSALGDERIETEVGGSVDAVSRLTGRPCRSFAYPNGRAQDFDARSVDVLLERGVRVAVSTRETSNLKDSDRFRLARWGIGTRHRLLEFRAVLAGLHPAQLRRPTG